MFEQIHGTDNPLWVSGDEKGTLAAQVRFAVDNGITAADYDAAYNSFAVQADLQRADDLQHRFKIEAVPTLVVAGKYVTDAEMAGSSEKLMRLVSELAAHEKHH